MRKIRIVVGCKDSSAVEALTEFCDSYGHELISVSNRAFDVADNYTKYNPDVVISDTLLHDINGDQLMGVVTSFADAPPVRLLIVSTDTADELVSVPSFDVDGLLCIPFDGTFLDKQIRSLLKENRHHSDEDEKERRKRLRFNNALHTVLRDLAIYPNSLGYLYITRSVLLMLSDEKYVRRVTRHLYPELASLFESDISSVERAIRYSVKQAWTQGSVKVIERLFGENIYEIADIPSNGAFMSLIYQQLKIDFYS